jgi:hypothetical protein
MVEVVRALAWPLALLLVVLALREPLSAFLRGIGGRISKLKVFSLELELFSASNATSTLLLDDLRNVASAAELSDPLRKMIKQVQAGTPADYAIIDLGAGEDWLTSRLYVAATMMERMRRVQVFVFVEKTQRAERRFIALASLRHVRWALAQKYPWLEAAWVRANLQAFPEHPATATPLPTDAAWLPNKIVSNWQPSPITSEFGTFENSTVETVVVRFIDSLQASAAPQPPGTPNEWASWRTGLWERGAYVTRESLQALLPAGAFDAWARDLRDSSRAKRTRAVLRCRGDFVAVLDEDKRFVRVSNRRALLEDIGLELGEEPDSA